MSFSVKKVVKNLKQARTDSAIEKFENSYARLSLATDIQKTHAKEDLFAAKELCSLTYQTELNNGMDLVLATAKKASCFTSALQALKAATANILSEHSSEQTDLINTLEATLNNPLYSQDFDAYWQNL